jgi:hypothetical protein
MQSCEWVDVIFGDPQMDSFERPAEWLGPYPDAVIAQSFGI